jgi:hypothetical protein
MTVSAHDSADTSLLGPVRRARLPWPRGLTRKIHISDVGAWLVLDSKSLDIYVPQLQEPQPLGSKQTIDTSIEPT